MVDFLFAILSILTIGGAIALITITNPFKATLGMLVCVTSIAGLFALLSSTFLFMVQLIVYSGAILTLTLFVIMFLNLDDTDLPQETNRNKYIAITTILLLPFNYMIMQAIFTIPNKTFEILEHSGTIKNIGIVLYSKWIMPFELISILLLISLIGSVILVFSNKNKGISK